MDGSQQIIKECLDKSSYNNPNKQSKTNEKKEKNVFTYMETTCNYFWK